MLGFLLMDNVHDVDLTYIVNGDFIEARFYIHYKTGGNWGYIQRFPLSIHEINLINQAIFEQDAFAAARDYINRKDKTIPDGSIIRVLERAPTLKNCLGVVASYCGDDNYVVCFQQGLVITIGVNFIEMVDPVYYAQCTWDITGRYTLSELKLLQSLCGVK